MRLREEANTFALYLASERYCIYVYVCKYILWLAPIPSWWRCSTQTRRERRRNQRKIGSLSAGPALTVSSIVKGIAGGVACVM